MQWLSTSPGGHPSSSRRRRNSVMARVQAFGVGFFRMRRRISIHPTQGSAGMSAGKTNFLDEALASAFSSRVGVRLSLSLGAGSGGFPPDIPPDKALASALFSALRSRSHARRFSAAVSEVGDAASSTRIHASRDRPSSRICLSMATLKLTRRAPSLHQALLKCIPASQLSARLQRSSTAQVCGQLGA